MSQTRKEPLAPKIFLGLGILAAGALAALVWPDWRYYLLAPSQRPLHAHHAIWRPSGFGGLSFGIAGAVLIFLNLTYLLRKRLLAVSWLGALRSWMAFHVFTGLVGAALILFHSAFQPRSALGTLGFAGLLIVAVTGLIGRYIYARAPRSLEGRELELEEIRRRLESDRAGLEKLGAPGEFFQKTLAPEAAPGSDRGVGRALFGLIAGDRRLRREQRALRDAIRRHAALQPLAREILPLALRYNRERQWLSRYNEWRSLMSGWRFFHRWVAVLLLVTAAFHIAVAARMGNLWILNRHP